MMHRLGVSNRRRWSEVEAVSFIHAVRKYCHHKEMVWDSDSAGSEILSFIVQNAEEKYKFFNVEHYWSIEYNPHFEVHNEFDIKEVSSKNDLEETVYGDRDWLFV